MSELTRCNYCSLQQLTKQAKKEGKRVERFPSAKMKPLGGFEIHLLRPGEKVGPKNWEAWMMTITDHCVC